MLVMTLKRRRFTDDGLPTVGATQERFLAELVGAVPRKIGAVALHLGVCRQYKRNDEAIIEP